MAPSCERRSLYSSAGMGGVFVIGDPGPGAFPFARCLRVLVTSSSDMSAVVVSIIFGSTGWCCIMPSHVCSFCCLSCLGWAVGVKRVVKWCVFASLRCWWVLDVTPLWVSAVMVFVCLCRARLMTRQ